MWKRRIRKNLILKNSFSVHMTLLMFTELLSCFFPIAESFSSKCNFCFCTKYN